MSNAFQEENLPYGDFAFIETTGLLPTEAMADLTGGITDTVTAQDWDGSMAKVYNLAGEQLTADQLNVLQQAGNALTDMVNDGIVPPAQARNFFYWLLGGALVASIPAVDTYEFVQGYVTQWARQNGWATLVGPVAPTPAVQAFIESATAASPLPSVQVPAPVLPSPSQGQQAVVQGTTGITPSTVTGGTPEGVSADQVSAALAVTAVDVLRVVAKVFDGMLPNMAPGQVPEALSQLNTAVNALEAQMGQVRAGQWPRGFIGLQEAVGGALQALNGLSQEVGILAQQMATKADSGLEDAIEAVSNTVSGIGDQVTGIVDNSIPELAAGIGTLTGTVGALDSLVDGSVVPGLASVTDLANQSAAKLALTDDDCLEALCDAETNVTDPIKAGGATPSLLSKLGSLLGLGWTVGALLAFLEAMATMFQAPIALQGVVTDVEQLASWAESAAIAIEQELPLQ